MSEQVLVTALYQYPVKSCRGIAVQRLPLDAIGPIGDRRVMLIDQRHQFVSQRTHPRLALVEVAWADGGIAVRAPEAAPLVVSLAAGDAALRPAQIWRDTVEARDLGEAAADYFSRYLGQRVRLVHLPDDSPRWVDRDYAPQPTRVGLADGFPLLLASEESLADLNARLDEPLPMDRFRPNLVVRGLPAWDEDDWRTMETVARADRALSLAVKKPCSRCNTTTVDQQSARRGIEPLRALAGFRRQGNKVYFGQNLLHAGPGVISVGDVFTITR